jgi:hypothetical protein
MEHQPKKLHNTYTIKEGDTLRSMAKILEKTEWEVSRFHNMFANPDQIINVTFPKNLHTLYITPDIEIKEPDNKPKVQFDSNNKLAIIPHKGVLHYHVKHEVTLGTETITRTYEVKVRLVDQKGKSSLYEIDVITKPIDQNLDTMQQELVAEVARAIYPLALEIDKNGNWFEVYNFQTISKRWQTVKKQVLDEFEGKDLDTILAFYDPKFHDKENFTNLLGNDIFLNCYFNNLYLNYTKDNHFERILHFPILPNIKKVVYKVTQEINPYLKNDKINIQITGNIADTRATKDYDNQLNEPYYALVEPTAIQPEGSYIASYILNSKTNCLEQASVNCFIKLGEVNQIKMTIQLLTNS